MIKSLLASLHSTCTSDDVTDENTTVPPTTHGDEDSIKVENGVLQPLIDVDVVLDNVLSFCLDDDLFTMRLVSKKFLDLLNNCDDGVPSLWMRLLKALCSEDIVEYWKNNQSSSTLIGFTQDDKNLRFMRYVKRCVYGFGMRHATIEWMNESYWFMKKDDEGTIFPHNAGQIPSLRNVCWFDVRWQMTIASPGTYGVMAHVKTDRTTYLQEGIDWKFYIPQQNCSSESSRRWGSMNEINSTERGWRWIRVGKITTTKPFTIVDCHAFNHNDWWKNSFTLDGVVFCRTF